MSGESRGGRFSRVESIAGARRSLIGVYSLCSEEPIKKSTPDHPSYPSIRRAIAPSDYRSAKCKLSMIFVLNLQRLENRTGLYSKFRIIAKFTLNRTYKSRIIFITYIYLNFNIKAENPGILLRSVDIIMFAFISRCCLLSASSMFTQELNVVQSMHNPRISRIIIIEEARGLIIDTGDAFKQRVAIVSAIASNRERSGRSRSVNVPHVSKCVRSRRRRRAPLCV